MNKKFNKNSDDFEKEKVNKKLKKKWLNLVEKNNSKKELVQLLWDEISISELLIELEAIKNGE